ncbi:hypothetical protein K151_2241 [Proteus hauseri ZMd44]|nr:hypothetical protein K151_2241 [Proteus hauseri ZMd44]
MDLITGIDKNGLAWMHVLYRQLFFLSKRSFGSFYFFICFLLFHPNVILIRKFDIRDK